jgi:3-hydroxyisobutyrate dehydrogenase
MSEPLGPGRTRVGWIGTGVMGAAMCGHVLAKGYAVTIHSRTRAKADPLVAQGAVWADTPAEVAARSDALLSIVGFPADVREVWLGPKGALAALRPGALAADLTTSDPGLARELAAAARERGVGMLDAPVSGGDVGARAGTLTVMTGGERADFDALTPVLACFGRNLRWHGPAGSGQQTKLVNQILIASNMIGVCEGLLYAQRAGLDPLAVIDTVSSGAAGSWGVANLGPRIARRDFAPGFFVEHFVKDIGLALREAERMGLALPGLALAERLYRELVAQGHARCGTQALVLALEKLARDS